MKSAAITNIGQKRKLNQDSFYTSDAPVGRFPNLYIVADGMGGHRAGDFASRYAVDRVVEAIRSSDRGEPRELVQRALAEANRGLRDTAAEHEEYYGMGTTFVLCTVDGDRMMAVNVGDSRLYIVSADGTIRQVTVDHSLVEEMVLAGGLDKRVARTHPDKNIITRAVGAEEELMLDYFSETIRSGDTILMCTDGLTNMVEDERIAQIVHEDGTEDERARELVNEANRNGGRDNITVILIEPYPMGE
nr:Stp1/IreP family PP2C-type Ser/Thr phosphatase [Lachnoclostridium sp. Marseille-P6806]